MDNRMGIAYALLQLGTIARAGDHTKFGYTPIFGGGAGATPKGHPAAPANFFSRVARGRVPSGRRAPHEKTYVIKRTWYYTVIISCSISQATDSWIASSAV